MSLCSVCDEEGAVVIPAVSEQHTEASIHHGHGSYISVPAAVLSVTALVGQVISTSTKY